MRRSPEPGRRLLLRLGAAGALALAHGGAAAAPSAELWPRWQAYGTGGDERLDHGPWQRLLAAYVSVRPGAVNRFAYGRVSDADRTALDAYLSALSRVTVSGLPRTAQRAFWINAYNALTVQVVLAHYPVASIRDIDISPGLFSSGPWGKQLFEVEGVPMSLDDIEHRILRPIWRDPRVHYALNCASIGCPDLQPTAFTASNAETLLETAARGFVNHPRGARVEGGALYVSSIYEWFKADFGDSDAGVIAHLKRYADPALASGLRTVSGIAGHDYDWRLNDAV